MTDLTHCSTITLTPEGKAAALALHEGSALADCSTYDEATDTITSVRPVDWFSSGETILWAVLVRLAGGEHLSRCEIESHGDAVDAGNRAAIVAAAGLVA